MYEEYSDHDIKVLAGYFKESDEILKSSSGGIATSLSRYFISIGGVVFGVSYTSDYLNAEYRVANSIDDIESFRGTKVFEIDTTGVFAKVKNYLENNTPVLFFGVPCINKSLRLFLKKNYERLLVCDLICSGQTFRRVHEEYCQSLIRKYHSKITYLSVRHKENGWLPEYLYVKFMNGTVYMEPFKSTEYGIAFKILKREGCCKCQIRGNNRTGDLMIGDYWGCNENDAFWNKNGVSVIFVHTDKAFFHLQQLKDFMLYETSFDHAVRNNLSVINKISVYQERDKLMNYFNRTDLHHAMLHSNVYKRVRILYLASKLSIYKAYKQIKKYI